ncbi:MAG TPA: hypothetical protein VHX44_19040, partial [Planctomycetota bacterium]|nr:hypothetical protein [Planctomycetota bacterium]
MKRLLVPTLLALAAFTSSTTAADVTIVPFDGSPIPIGAGARALGMGGAFTAVADDATANTWNPAGMTQLERPEASISGAYNWRQARFASDTDSNSSVDLDHLAV